MATKLREIVIVGTQGKMILNIKKVLVKINEEQP